MESIITAIIRALASIFPTIYSDRFKKGDGDKHQSGNASELSLLQSYIALIKPDTPMSDSHADIITVNFNEFEKDFKKLIDSNDWKSIIKVKERLREYFEYSALYEKGVAFGIAYEEALRNDERESEAIWALLKNVGYMLVLSGEYAQASEVFKNVLDKLKEYPELIECKFYCYRYFGIACFRDNKINGLNKAKEYFNLAESLISKFDQNSKKEKELRARIYGNKGNLTSREGEFGAALSYYNQSLKLFHDVEDQEHVGIAMLQIAKHLILFEKQMEMAIDYLNKAKVIFTQIGWVEGLARVDEQYARYYYFSAKSNPDSSQKQSLKGQAQHFVKTSEAFFVKVKHKAGIGRIQELMEQIESC
jgi:tetratricopeptide (TPR) repeat protein